jgi:hypothetical protein
MELDILILTTSSLPEHPFIFISGNLNNLPAFASGPSLILGNYTNVHYQSLLPEYRGKNIEKAQNTKEKIVINAEQNNDDFIYV